jgi:phage I-like protein
VKITAAIDLRALAPSDVERADGGAPTAFRIWRGGQTTTDKGVQYFTERSARLLMAEQELRGNLFSIDVDHLSLKDTAPPESHKAFGWHRLEVRPGGLGAPELWAVNVEWTDIAKSGLEKDPPEWRYFSPAYDVDPKTREVVGYLNTALTNNPATWGVTALASSKGKETIMTKREMIAVFQHMAKGETPEAKACAAVLAMLESGKVPDDTTAADPPPADDGGQNEPDGDEATRTAATRIPPAPAGEPPPASSTTDPVLTKLLSRVQELEATLASRAEADERARILATRPDFSPAVRAAVEKLPLDHLREMVKTLPKGITPPATITATRGAGQGSDDPSDRTPRLPPEERARMDAAMGLGKREPAIKRVANRTFFSTMNHEEARTFLANRRTAGGAQ